MSSSSLNQVSLAEFDAAARWVASLLPGISEPSWAGPGIGQWSLRSLVGHTSRALLTVEQYLQTPAGVETTASATDYFRSASSAPTADPARVLERGAAAGIAMGDTPTGFFSDAVDRVTALVSGAGDPLISCPWGGIKLSNYLPTRTFELVVHGIDISHATNREASPPCDALRQALQIALELAVSKGVGVGLLEALTGRSTLQTGFSVLDA